MQDDLKRKMIFVSIVCVSVLTACQNFATSDESTMTTEIREETQMEQALITAAAKGDTASVLELLASGAKIDATNQQGDTAIMAATKGAHVATVEALIAQGADLNRRNHNQDNVLLYASAAGDLAIVQLAIEAGADTTITNRFGGTGLIPAADRGHVNIVEYLLTKSDVDVNHLNNLHWTALLEAVILGDGSETYQTIVQLLVDHGADVNQGDREGVTPLQHAIDRGFTEIERILQAAGA